MRCRTPARTFLSCSPLLSQQQQQQPPQPQGKEQGEEEEGPNATPKPALILTPACCKVSVALSHPQRSISQRAYQHGIRVLLVGSFCQKRSLESL